MWSFNQSQIGCSGLNNRLTGKPSAMMAEAGQHLPGAPNHQEPHSRQKQQVVGGGGVSGRRRDPRPRPDRPFAVGVARSEAVSPPLALA